jgi:bacterioferritin-associated ferredoxin
MRPDDELCLCFHVTQRKVANYIRLEKPRRVAQLSECFGAGTGCGWCRPFLEQMFRAAQTDEGDSRRQGVGDAGDKANAGATAGTELPAAADYARQRAQYVRTGGGTPPPGATLPPPGECS